MTRTTTRRKSQATKIKTKARGRRRATFDKGAPIKLIEGDTVTEIGGARVIEVVFTPERLVGIAAAEGKVAADAKIAPPKWPNLADNTPYLPTGYDERKSYPIVTGVLDYFPLALLEVAAVSAAGNAQHNPGEPLHWARGKSMDQVNTAVRHLMERGMLDTDKVRHLAKAVWRLLAALQIECEQAHGLPPSRGCYGDGT